MSNIRSIEDYHDHLQQRLHQGSLPDPLIVFQELKSLSLKPTEETLRILLQYCLQTRNWKAADSIVRHHRLNSVELITPVLELFVRTERFEKIRHFLSLTQRTLILPEVIDTLFNIITAEDESRASVSKYSVIIEAWKNLAYKRRRNGFTPEAIANLVAFCVLLRKGHTVSSTDQSLTFPSHQLNVSSDEK
jgi:thermostable 8-oxoguanine DNA glycosylase